MACEDCDPVGNDDIAKRLGVKRNTVVVWRSRHDFPPPRWTISGRPCWDWLDVEAWLTATGRPSSVPSRER